MKIKKLSFQIKKAGISQLATIALCTLALSACNAELDNTAPSPFVQVENGRFELNGAPYHYAGANYWYGAYLAATDKPRLIRELDLMRARGITNLRVLALSEASALSRSVSPAVITTPEQYTAELQQGLDILLAEMAARDMKAVLYLTNFWQWSGGMSQYLVWHQDAELDDPDVSGKWDEYIENTTDFYRCAPCQTQYLDAASNLIERTNSVTSNVYRNDPTIMAWQLANEPRSGGANYNPERATDYIRWVRESAAAIKSMAPSQLVSSGSEGLAGSQEQAEVYLKAHDTPAIDYLTVHLWVKNWGWFDARKPEQTYDNALENATRYLDTHVQIASDLNKPLVLEEFGVERDGGSFSPESGTTYRDKFLTAIYTRIEQDVTSGGPFAGSNFWTFSGYGRSGNSEYQWQPGNDFLGDPPQEPQGLNSVFDSDISTLEIIQSHADTIGAAATEQQVSIP
ncbi:glycoside hydrolase 5 family protein [Microbulbifer sp. MCCC 1A16149]|uniref:glycoside hydrolase 5 family protein n=1 Tax=Microbulbifer sp. MCCC 1A16149 TaxID=3411322 RepID=UPI003D1282C3